MPSQSTWNRSFSPYLEPRVGWGWGHLLQPLTFSLCSFLFTITAVICWSMNIKMVQSRAGMSAANTVHQGLGPMGLMNHPRSSLVGCNKAHASASSPSPATSLALILSSVPVSEHLPALASRHPLPWGSAGPVPSLQAPIDTSPEGIWFWGCLLVSRRKRCTWRWTRRWSHHQHLLQTQPCPAPTSPCGIPKG